MNLSSETVLLKKTFNYLVEKIPDFSFSLNVHVGYVSEIGLEIEYYVSFD